MGPHSENGILMRLYTYISQHTVLRVKQFTKSLEEEHVRWQFTFIFMFNNKEHIVILFLSIFLILGLLPVHMTGIFQIRGLQSNRVKNSFILPGLHVSFAKKFSFIDGIINQFNTTVLFRWQVFLDLLLSLVIHIVLNAEIQT